MEKSAMRRPVLLLTACLVGLVSICAHADKQRVYQWTDSQGVVYAFFTHFSGESLEGSETLIKSSDGGATWGKPRDVIPITDPCFNVDPVSFRCVGDGIAGARIDLSAGPSFDIANGAPTGEDATDEIVGA